MKILTEKEYQEAIEAAEKRGYEKAKQESCVEREDQDFRNSVWREIGDLRRDMFNQIERIHREIGNGEELKTCGCVKAAGGTTTF